MLSLCARIAAFRLRFPVATTVAEKLAGVEQTHHLVCPHDDHVPMMTISPTKLGAKNWLFIGSQRGGELAALAYTLIENCKRHGVHLRDYLSEAARQIIEQGQDAANALTPARFASRPTAKSAA